ARAEAAFRAAEPDHPDSAELQADLGNAALGAADFGTATLAFRRALRLDAGHERARKNLTWLRGRLPDNLRPHHGGTAATLFFFHAWRRSTRLLVGAAAFAIAVLLLVPWTARRRDGVRLAAVVPGLVWLAMTASLLLEDPRVDDGVVMQAQPLRSADSAGAAPAMAAPLPPGVEVTIVERREGWTKIRTPGGATGWLPDSAVASVAGD
ncbi:MAG: hypothetical protein KC464_20990, partial [Myxococcales bacterium]|nr:hypothetical protein [Myxococcales bacterium]